MKTVLSLSGGMDSVTLLGVLLEQGYSIYPVIFTYGSKHNQYENKAAFAIAQYYLEKGSPIQQPINIDLTGAFSAFKSDLLLSGGNIPEGHYQAENMQRTVVPGRNTIFIACMLGIAESCGANAIALGVHAGDHHIYPDCRAGYINSMNQAVIQASNGEIRISTPFLQDTKTTILEKGFSLSIPVPYHLTRTCYKDQPISCGKCGSCQERLEGFANIKKKDPIQYE